MVTLESSFSQNFDTSRKSGHHNYVDDRFISMGISHTLVSDDYRWNGPHVDMDTYINNGDLQAFADALAQAVRPLYVGVDAVLDKEVAGINSHEFDTHIKSVLKIAGQLVQIAKDAGSPFSHEEQLVSVANILLHDIALALVGKRDHEVVAGILAPQIINGRSDQADRLIRAISHDVGAHVTAKYGFNVVKGNQEYRPYSLMVLSDETDIQRSRTTKSGKNRFTRGEKDGWFFVNYFTISSEWCVGDSGTPTWNLRTHLGAQNALAEYQAHLDASTARAESPLTQEDFQAEYLDVLTKLVLNPKKNNLFRSCVRSIFGRADYDIRIIDSRGKVLEIIHSMSVKRCLQ